MIIVIILISALCIMLLFCIFYLWIDRSRLKKSLQQRIDESSSMISGLQRRVNEASGSNEMLSERVEKCEAMLSGYRNLLTEVHATLTQSRKKDYKGMAGDISNLTLRLVDFAKKDYVKADAFDAEARKTNFIERLMERYPEVTPSSAQLAYMIYMNMPVSNISNILGITAKSVQMGRFRLRKKMGLQETDCLEDVLQQLNQ